MPCGDRSAYGTWTRDRLRADARRWHRLTGEWPTSTDWHATVGGKGTAAGRQDAVLRFRELTGPWPTVGTVSEQYGTWSMFMADVGGHAKGTCKGVKHGSREAFIRAAIDRFERTRLMPGSEPTN